MHAHAHDFLVLVYFERGGGSLRLEAASGVGGRRRVCRRAGEVVGVGDDTRGLAEAEAGPSFLLRRGARVTGAGGFPSWRAHRCCSPSCGARQERQRLTGAVAERTAWSRAPGRSGRELQRSRMATGSGPGPLTSCSWTSPGWLLMSRATSGSAMSPARRVFGVIEEQYQRLSRSGRSAAVSLTPGHLTTSVGTRRGARCSSGLWSGVWPRHGACW